MIYNDTYAVLPAGTMRDITTSQLPFWEDTRLWVIARPLSGFAETFSQYVMEVQPGGGGRAQCLSRGVQRTPRDSDAPAPGAA